MTTAKNKELIIAANNNDFERVYMLISNGAKINYCDPHLGTALISAVKQQNNNIVLFLLANGADVDQTNQFNVSPIELALKISNTELVNILNQHGAKLKKNTSNFYLNQIRWHLSKHTNNPSPLY